VTGKKTASLQLEDTTRNT